MKTGAQYQAGLRPNGVAAQLARLATRLSGPMRVVQPPAAVWHAHRLWSPCGGATHADGGDVQTWRGLRGGHHREEGLPSDKGRRAEAHHNGESTVRAESGRCGGG
jgi:hypothetical protein